MPEHTHRANVQKGLLAAAVGGLLYTFDLPLLRLAELDQWTLVFGRGVFLFVAITVGWLMMPGRDRRERPFIAGPAGLAAVLINTTAPIFYIIALSTTTAANVVFIMALVPLISAVLSRLFLRERVHYLTWIASLLALAGVAVILNGGIIAGNWIGDVAALLSALCTSLTLVVIRASGKELVTSLATGSLFSAILAAALFGAAPAAIFHPAHFGLPAWFWLGFDGLVFIPLALILMSESPKHIPSADVSMFFLLETVLTPLWTWLLTGEQPSQWSLVGGALIVSTLLVHSWWRLQLTLRPVPRPAD